MPTHLEYNSQSSSGENCLKILIYSLGNFLCYEIKNIVKKEILKIPT